MQHIAHDERPVRPDGEADHQMTYDNTGSSPLSDTRSTNYQGIQLDGHVQAQFGDHHHHGITINATNVSFNDRTPDQLSALSLVPTTPRKTFGLCLGNAPQLEQEAFIGRSAELQQLREWFSLDGKTQRVVSIVGMGGLGKTQLSLAYARNCSMRYTSIFWVNAKDEPSLRHGLCTLADMIMIDTAHLTTTTKDEQPRVDRVRRWLSEEWNHQWLMIFDNYDDPDLPNIHSNSGFDIRSYLPHRTQGHIIITTRTPKLTFSKRLMLKRFDNIDFSLAVLAQRAHRDFTTDSGARLLADRLDGLPLALATAGVYLGQTNISCGEYLQLYQSEWMDLHGPDTEELLEYEDRTLSSTWAVSFNQLHKVDADAAELLKFWAYFSNKDIWYELVRAGSEKGPAWMSRVTANKLKFDRTIARLQDYSLVEVNTGSYDIHPCIHTWLTSYFDVDRTLFLASLECIVRSVPQTSSMQYWAITHRLLLHIDRLNDGTFNDLWNEFSLDHNALNYLTDSAALLCIWDRFDQAQTMYTRALTGFQQIVGHDHPSTLCVMVNLGLIFSQQGWWDRAETIYLEALTGYERMTIPDPQMALDICHNLGLLYRDLAKFDQAEEMFTRALADTALILEHDHPSRLRILNHVGLVYWDQGRFTEAEKTLQQVLIGTENALGSNHPSTLHVVNHLGLLYYHQGLQHMSEQMLLRALAGRETILGRDHRLTLDTVDNLGVLYQGQGRYEKAEEHFARVWAAHQGRPISVHLAGTVSYLMKDLNRTMKSGAVSQQDARRKLAHLIPSLDTTAKGIYKNKYHTARVLLELGDQENALTAFVHNRGILCDGCDENINPELGGYHVCRQCLDTDLCNPCKMKYDDKSLIVPHCSGHEYFDMDAAISRFPDRAIMLDSAGMKAWIERLKEQYPAIDDA